ncbi:MAG: MerR family DNA-binding transcriptional regulator [Bryobacteraceae bacterium]
MTIGEVAKQAGLRASAIRFYEEAGLLPKPFRTSGSGATTLYFRMARGPATRQRVRVQRWTRLGSYSRAKGLLPIAGSGSRTGRSLN